MKSDERSAIVAAVTVAALVSLMVAVVFVMSFFARNRAGDVPGTARRGHPARPSQNATALPHEAVADRPAGGDLPDPDLPAAGKRSDVASPATSEQEASSPKASPVDGASTPPRFTREEVVRETGKEWKVVQFEPSSGVVAKLGVPYPGAVAEPTSVPHPGVSGPDVDNGRALDISTAFLAGHAGLFGIGDPADMAVSNVSRYDYPAEYSERKFDYTVDYNQTYHGIPVVNGRAKVMMTADGEVFLVKNHWVPDVTAPTTAARTADDSVKAAQRHLGTDIAPSGAPELCVMAPDSLCWRMNFESPVFKEIFINAINGEVKFERSNVIE